MFVKFQYRVKVPFKTRFAKFGDNIMNRFGLGALVPRVPYAGFSRFVNICMEKDTFLCPT